MEKKMYTVGKLSLARGEAPSRIVGILDGNQYDAMKSLVVELLNIHFEGEWEYANDENQMCWKGSLVGDFTAASVEVWQVDADGRTFPIGYDLKGGAE